MDFEELTIHRVIPNSFHESTTSFQFTRTAQHNRENVLDTLRRIRADAQMKAIPVVVLVDAHELNKDGALHRLQISVYLVKPVDTAKLTTLVKKLLSM